MNKDEVQHFNDIWFDYDEDNKQLHGDNQFDGITTDRKCTDAFCLIIFIIFNIMFLGLSGYGNNYSVLWFGDPQRLSYGFDFRAQVCGLSGLEDRRFMYFPISDNVEYSMCVSACPYYYIANYYCIYDNDHETLLHDWPCFDAYETTAYGFYCLPAEREARELVHDELTGIMQILKGVAADILGIWDIMLVGAAFSTLVGFVYTVIFKNAKLMRRATIVTMNINILLLAFISVLFYFGAVKDKELMCGDYGEVSPEYCDDTSYIIHLCLCGLSGLYCLYYAQSTLSNKQKIPIALEGLELTSKPVKLLDGMKFFPFAQLGIGLITILFQIMLLCFAMSTNTEVTVEDEAFPGGEAKRLEFTEFEKFILGFGTIMALWWLSFLVKLGDFVLAAGVTIWYFTREKSVLFVIYIQGPLTRAAKLCSRFHMGSIVMGSVVRPLMFIPQNFFKFLDYCQRKAAMKDWKCMTKTLKCAKYYRNFFRFFTPNTFIYLCIFGEPYYIATKKSFYLLERNGTRVSNPMKAGGYIFGIFNNVILFSGFAFTYAWIIFANKTPYGKLTVEVIYPLGPTVVMLIINWFISKVFAGGLAVCMRTVLVSAACDEEMFVGDQRFIENDLRDYMDRMGEEQNEHHKEAMKKVNGIITDGDKTDNEKEDVFKPYMSKVVPIYEKDDEDSLEIDTRRPFLNVPGAPRVDPGGSTVAPMTLEPEEVRTNQPPSILLGRTAKYV